MLRLPTAGRALGLVLLALSTVATTAWSQAPAPRLGPIAGVSMATFAGKDATDVKNRLGFMAGVFAEIPVSDIFSIQPEALYAMKGSKIDEGGDELTAKLAVVEIPLLFRVNIPTGGSSSLRMQGMDGKTMSVRPHLYAGPAIAFRSSCKVSEAGGGESFDCDEVQDLKSTDFSVVFGGGVDISGFTLGVRYDLGLTKLIKGTTENDIKSRALTFYGSYGFALR